MPAMEYPMQEHAVLLRAYARVQERCSRLLVEQAALVERLEAQIVRLRGALVARDSAIAIVREELAARAAAGGAVPKRLHALLAPGNRRHVSKPPEQEVPADLREKAVLCVGREEEAPSLARQLVEIVDAEPFVVGGQAGAARRRRRAARSSARCRWFPR
jgi:hypothetical protein